MSAAQAILAVLEARGVNVASLCLDSRSVRPGDVFVALKGHRFDGHAYISQAVAHGAAAVLCEIEPSTPLPVPHIAVANMAARIGEIAHLVYGRPSEHLWLCGVTGTNGKTSVSHWIAQAMAALGKKCAVIGTLGNGFPGALAETLNTTPDAVGLHSQLAQFLAQGAVGCAMEVSSIGVEEGRVGGAAFATAVLTNLSRDHLDYHGDMGAYSDAKERLFDTPGLAAAVLNLDDLFGARLAAKLAGRVPTIGYTLEGRGGADTVLAIDELAMTETGMTFSLNDIRVQAPLVGRFNAANLLAVIGALLTRGERLEDCVDAVRQMAPPPGRMQSVGGEGQPLVVVDYAHTPDALEKALTALRATATARGGKLICVFGCGGDRDPGKRPLMGAVAEACADCVVLTSDNPRSEDPRAILAEIRAGMRGKPLVEPDRAAAIRFAVMAAEANDTLLLAGKGHEPYQETAGVRLPFSDLKQAQDSLGARP